MPMISRRRKRGLLDFVMFALLGVVLLVFLAMLLVPPLGGGG